MFGNTIRDLNSALAGSLSTKQSERYFDRNHQQITTRADIERFIADQLGSEAKLVSFELSNGWLDKGGRTTIRSSEAD